jgi:citrate synthase
MSELSDLSFVKDDLIKNNSIDPSLYQQYEVKRGLRNQDGSGVLAGLTHISSVVGFHNLDGELIPKEGDLKLRGLSLQELTAKFKPSDRFQFESVCFLLLVGRLPNPDELTQFVAYLAAHRRLPDAIITNVIKGVPSKNIMNKLQTAISALYAYDDDPETIDPYSDFLKSARVIAKLPLIVAYSYLAAYGNGEAQFLAPPTHYSQSEAFLYCLHNGKDPNEFEAHVIDLALVLHAEHGGGNNSTFTTHVVSSSQSDIYSTLAAAIASLKGPLHGSANKKVMDMMADIKANVSDWSDSKEVCAYLSKLIRKEAGDHSGKLYGLGHAVYTTSDPRAVIIKSLAKKVALDHDRMDEFMLYSLIAEKGPAVFNDVKGSSKVISPNVDFYSGFVYDCLGIPHELFTPIFAMARTAGWCAHRIEEGLSGKRIIRPGYKCVT